LIKGQDNRCKNDPVYIEIRNKENNEESNSCCRGQEYTSQPEAGIDFLHDSFISFHPEKCKL